MISIFYAKLWVPRLFVHSLLSHSTKKNMLGNKNVYQKTSSLEFFFMGRRYHNFLPKILSVRLPNEFVREPFCVSKKFCYRKSSCIAGGTSRICRPFFISRDRKTSKVSLLCFRIFLVWKKIMEKRWRVVWRFSVEKSLFHSAEKLPGGTHECFRIFRLSISLMHEKGVSLFSVELFFVSQCQKNSWGNPSVFQKNLVSKKVMHRRGIMVLSYFFVSQRQKKFMWEHFCVSKNFWYRKF